MSEGGRRRRQSAGNEVRRARSDTYAGLEVVTGDCASEILRVIHFESQTTDWREIRLSVVLSRRVFIVDS